MRAAADVLNYVRNEDVKFIRLAFCDIFGKQKNISIMPGELDRAFEYGIAFDSSAIRGFGNSVFSDLFLHPDPNTLSVLPWRPEQGRVVRMYCTVKTPDGKPFECCTRTQLINAAETAAQDNSQLLFGTRAEFYLFDTDSNGQKTSIPSDKAGLMDIAPLDRGENVRRQICLNLEQMGISPESSCHLHGSGQNSIKLKQTEMLRSADDLMSFFSAVKAAASTENKYAEFLPKPHQDMHGSGLNIEISLQNDDSGKKLLSAAAGVAAHLPEITLFLDPTQRSYDRLKKDIFPRVIDLNDSGSQKSIVLSTPDCSANPYLIFTLLIHAALDGIRNDLSFDSEIIDLPLSYTQAKNFAMQSDFIKKIIPDKIAENYYADK